MTRSCSKRLLQEPFKVPYPITLTASAPVELEEVCTCVCILGVTVNRLFIVANQCY